MEVKKKPRNLNTYSAAAAAKQKKLKQDKGRKGGNAFASGRLTRGGQEREKKNTQQLQI